VQVLHRVDEVRHHVDAARFRGASVGLVPTMGALHAGHASLVERAAAECDEVVVTVFVNPLQFATGEDLAAYPRTLDGDVRLADTHGASVVFAPEESEMYPGGRDAVLTQVTVDGLSNRWEGASRPTHFAGVCTVVAKLLHIVGPCRAFFGEKDFQQLTIIRAMVADLSFPVEVVGCPTIREPDGLAMSSRNVHLSASHRAQATVLSQALVAVAGAYAIGERDVSELVRIAMERIAAAPDAEPDYVAIVDPTTLDPVTMAQDDSRVLVAVRFGSTRLLDNAPIRSEDAA